MKHEVNSPYIQSYIFSGKYFYIHQHRENIGRANNGNAETEDSLASIYASKKQQAFNAVKTQFRNLLQGSVIKSKSTPAALDILKQAMSDDNIMTELTQNMGQSLSQALNVNKMAKLMKNELSLNNIDFNKIITKEAVTNISQFNKLLQVLSKACLLINNQEAGSLLAEALLDAINNKKNKTISRSQLGKNLNNKLENFNKKIKNAVRLTDFDIAQINNIIEQLNSLANVLVSGKTSKKKDISAEGLRQLTQNIFNTGFAEAISGEIAETAYVSLIGAINKAQLTGSKKTTISYTNTMGKYKKQIGQSAYGKADVVFPNISFQLNKTGTKEDKELMISLGISDKFYTQADFPAASNTVGNNRFSSGSGGKLKDILRMLFGADFRALYLSYNTVAHGPQISKAQEALQDIVLTRSLVYLFGARGGNADFAQYMFVNGQIISLWDIILSTKQNIGKSESQLKERSHQVLSISFGDERKKAIENAKKDDEITRVYSVNKEINSITIRAHLDLTGLINSGKKVF